MFTEAVLCGFAADDGDGVLHLTGFEVATTPLVTLVAAGTLPAVRTGSLDVPVRQRLVNLGVPGDADLLLDDVTLALECPHDVAGELGVRLVVSVTVVVELHPEAGELLRVLLVPLQGERLGVAVLLLGVDRDRRPVHVRPTDKGGLLVDGAQRPGEDVTADVVPQVADVQVAVGVR